MAYAKEAKTAVVVRVKTGYSKVDLEVVKTYRGDAPPVVHVGFRVFASDCDKPMNSYQDGKSYLWLTNRAGDRLKENVLMFLCESFTEVDQAQEMIDFLEREARKKKKPAKTKDVSKSAH